MTWNPKMAASIDCGGISDWTALSYPGIHAVTFDIDSYSDGYKNTELWAYTQSVSKD